MASMLHSLLLLIVPAQIGAALPADSIAKLRDRARTAEARFERTARNLAPFTWSGFDGSSCDEVVGRFCLRFDSTSVQPPAKEVGRVVDTRREAIEAIRRYFSAVPGELSAAGPLVRLLVQDDRAREAVSAARTFAVLSADTVWNELLLGVAFHAAGEESDAERHLVAALSRMDPVQQRVWTDPRWLLDPHERRALRRLPSEGLAEYERKFWLITDPFWLTPANEHWIEHIARHAEARLLARVPVVAGMTSWGEDLDELTVRYGTPTSRARTSGRTGHDDSMIEYYDTAQRSYAPSRWHTAGFPEPPLPGTRPPLYSARARSGYALRLVDRVFDLPHQITRFVDGDDVVLRIDGAVSVPFDSVPVSSLEVGVFTYDSAFTRRVDVSRRIRWAPDSTRFTLLLRTRPGRVIYSAEALDTAVAFGARARYAIDAFLPRDGPVVSDLLICAPFPPGPLPDQHEDARLSARNSLVFAPGDTLGVYAEVYRIGAAETRVEIGLRPADGPGAIARFGRWLGRSIGLLGAESNPRVSWQARDPAGLRSLAVNLPLDPRRRGNFVLVLRITDPITGTTTEARRPILIR